MGVILAATDALNWLATLTSKSPAELTNALLDAPVEPTDVLFLPYLGGERTPINNAHARGVFVSLKHSTDAQQMTRAVLQGVAFAFKDSQHALAQAGTSLTQATAIGGGAKSEYWIKVLASVLELPLDITADGDYGASLGAARLGMIAAEDADPLAVCIAPPTIRTIEPGMHTDGFKDNYERYKEAYAALKPIM
jgi:xylulokinase